MRYRLLLSCCWFSYRSDPITLVPYNAVKYLSIQDIFSLQFIANDFKAFIKVKGIDHVRTSPHYPQSNGKLERWHKSLKSECIRPKTPLNLDAAKRLVSAYVSDYNHHRLHSAIGYVAPADKLAGKAPEILANRDLKLVEARQLRAQRRQAQLQLSTDA